MPSDRPLHRLANQQCPLHDIEWVRRLRQQPHFCYPLRWLKRRQVRSTGYFTPRFSRLASCHHALHAVTSRCRSPSAEALIGVMQMTDASWYRYCDYLILCGRSGPGTLEVGAAARKNMFPAPAINLSCSTCPENATAITQASTIPHR